jgi:cytochrome c-type biogenesis protein CcmE
MESAIASRTARPTSRSRAGAVKFFAGGLVILAAIAYVTVSSFQSNAVYYFTLQEFNAQRAKIVGQTVRVNGPLDKSSIQLDQKNMVLNFKMIDGGVVLPVVYRGVVPDTLTTGESVVAEGHLDSQGVFQADTILVKCPSKYEQKTSSS